MRAVQDAIRKLKTMPEDELVVEARDLGVSLELLTRTKDMGRLPVVNFCRRWRGYPRGRGVDDAVGGRWRVRGLRRLQVRRPCWPWPCHRASGPPLQRPADTGPGFQGPGRGNGRHKHPDDSRKGTPGAAWHLASNISPAWNLRSGLVRNPEPGPDPHNTVWYPAFWRREPGRPQ